MESIINLRAVWRWTCRSQSLSHNSHVDNMQKQRAGHGSHLHSQHVIWINAHDSSAARFQSNRPADAKVKGEFALAGLVKHSEQTSGGHKMSDRVQSNRSQCLEDEIWGAEFIGAQQTLRWNQYSWSYFPQESRIWVLNCSIREWED